MRSRPKLERTPQRPFDTIDEPENPVIVAGYGRFGQIVSRVLRARASPSRCWRQTPPRSISCAASATRCINGDASRLELLRAAHAEEAKIFVLAIDDVEASVAHRGTRAPALPGSQNLRARP